MATKLVIVESPAKAKTIGGFLGKDFEVLASIGHIRDLPPNGRNLDESIKKQWWADYAVDVDNGFKPIYEIPAEKRPQVKKLKDALKGKSTLVLATDEDREGESISWHLLEVLKPAKDVKVQRIAFHEITRDAIQSALDHPRDLNRDLVDAQETRRVLDRLFGYTLSPVLWSKVMRNLSAGRVQTPAVKILVDREKLRRQFVAAQYWDLSANLSKDSVQFPATLRAINGQRIAGSADFDDNTGQLLDDRKSRVLLDEATARAIHDDLQASSNWQVADVNATEGMENPAPPFMTTTLQQEASRKLGLTPDRAMRIAQSLYEGISLDGETVGLITYMRTDSLTLASSAVDSIRGFISGKYPKALPPKARTYTNKVRNAQEAHEAIRPTDAARTPASIKKFLNDDQFRLYDLIWKRTIACQMLPARVLRTEATIRATTPQQNFNFVSTGKQILFEGFREIYKESKDEEEETGGDRTLPILSSGDRLTLESLTTEDHETRPPARFTDASLIKKLEENGIGRPSTYASIISVILDRNYAKRIGKQLVPSFLAFLTMELLEGNFSEFVDLNFTKNLDDKLDEIAEGEQNAVKYLDEFFLGKSGLKTAVDERKKELPFPNFQVGKNPETNEDIVVRIANDGRPFIQLGPRENKKYANVPDDLAPADLTVSRALDLFNQKSAEQEVIGIDPVTGRGLIAKQNRGSYYLETQRTQEELEAKVKPRWISIPQGVNPADLSPEELAQLCHLPRQVGKSPETGEEVLFKLGKFGAYLERGKETRSIGNWRDGLQMSAADADVIFAQPKAGPARSAGRQVLADLGKIGPDGAEVKVLSGRFGPYVTDGTTNATLPRGQAPDQISAEVALELLEKKREAGPSTPRTKRKAASSARSGRTATKTATKSTAARSSKPKVAKTAAKKRTAK